MAETQEGHVAQERDVKKLTYNILAHDTNSGYVFRANHVQISDQFEQKEAIASDGDSIEFMIRWDDNAPFRPKILMSCSGKIQEQDQCEFSLRQINQYPVEYYTHLARVNGKYVSQNWCITIIENNGCAH